MRSKNNGKQLLKASDTYLKKAEVFGYPKRISVSVLSKGHLHNYFADRMAMFSVIMGYIYDKIQQSHLSDSFTVLHDKLAAMRSDFLLNYHNHTSGKRINRSLNKVKSAFELICQFEERVILEILNFGIKPKELIDFNTRMLKLAADKDTV